MCIQANASRCLLLLSKQGDSLSNMFFAAGPHLVDLGGGPLGSTFYAPNVLNNDPHGESLPANFHLAQSSRLQSVIIQLNESDSVLLTIWIGCRVCI